MSGHGPAAHRRAVAEAGVWLRAHPSMCAPSTLRLQAKGVASGTMGTNATIIGGLLGIGILTYLASTA